MDENINQNMDKSINQNTDEGSNQNIEETIDENINGNIDETIEKNSEETVDDNIHGKIKKANRIFLIVLVIVIIAVIIGAVTSIISGKNNSKKEENKEYKSTAEMKEKAPLINMDNKENAKIESGEKINSSQTLQEDKTVSGLKLTKIQIHTEKGLSYFNATVENTAQKDFERKAIYLKFKKSDGSVLANVGAVIPTIKAGGKGTINASTIQDIANANDFEIELAK